MDTNLKQVCKFSIKKLDNYKSKYINGMLKMYLSYLFLNKFGLTYIL